ncbi:MAG TPA: DsbA family protein [Solirubrobacteraceae bacterium]|jgi:2-hydroxychromene-2-carboxylate isomerase|nr:DsbA family protein [Solirubrobacteraceae bacterium]
MGEVTVLAHHRATRRLRAAGPRTHASHRAEATVAFYFDPSCPFSYLAAERIERRFSGVAWIPVPASTIQLEEAWADPRVARLRRLLAERRAAELKLPLVWPDRFPTTGAAALRVAFYAARTGVGAEFALAAARLAFCGGFDLDDPVNLAEAAAAAGIGLEACLAAAENDVYDGPLHTNARGLLALGITQLPALRAGPRWFAGEASLAEASAWWAHAPVAAIPG